MRRLTVFALTTTLIVIALVATSPLAANADGKCPGGQFYNSLHQQCEVSSTRPSGNQETKRPHWREPTFKDLQKALTAAEQKYAEASLAGKTCISVGDTSLVWTGQAYVRKAGNLCTHVLITPAEAARRVVASMTFIAPAAAVGPAPELNKWNMLAVGFPYWLWADGGSQGTRHVSASVAGLKVSIDASLTSVVWDMGDGTTPFTCTAYSRWDRSIPPMTPSPTCGYTYQTTSGDGQFTITATAHWRVRWTADGESGVIDIGASQQHRVTVGELVTVRR